MDNLRIYIPSLCRADRQRTHKSIPQLWQPYVTIVVGAGEEELYERNNPGAYIVACPLEGISNVRQWIMENANCKYVLMLDDDMTFNVRRGERLLVAEPVEVGHMIGILEQWLRMGFVHVGISARQGNNHVDGDFAEVTRVNNAYAFNVDKFHVAGARFDRLPVMEDFDVTLTLLEKGYPNRVTYKYAWGQAASGEAGGCSIYRNDAMQEQAAFRLKELHPHSVTIKKKVSKQAWGGFSASARYDVNIQWKKAYRPKGVSGALGKFFK